VQSLPVGVNPLAHLTAERHLPVPVTLAVLMDVKCHLFTYLTTDVILYIISVMIPNQLALNLLTDSILLF
jgi:hypothetical protein